MNTSGEGTEGKYKEWEKIWNELWWKFLDDKAGALAALLLQLKLELPFDRVVTIGTVLVPILLVTLVFTKNFAGEARG